MKAYRQHGAYLVMMALMVAVLIAVAALVLDIGRVLVLRADMQAAADAAALAGAAELDSRPDAMDRARVAARNLLVHEGRFARVRDLLGEEGIPDQAITFYCVIGARYDVTPDLPGFSEYCSGTQEEPGKYLAAHALEANYVQIRLDSEMVEGGRFVSDLMFLPVLGAIGIDAATEVGLRARAIAGRSHFACNYPPMLMCDPFEGTGDRFRDRMTVGGHIQLKQQGANQWTPGNFGFLQPPTSGPGAGDVALALADEGLVGCEPPRFTTQTGGMTQKTTAGINTRFGIYGPPSPFNRPDAPDLYPPAINVSAYPLDNTTELHDSRLGRGDWDFEGYWAANHPGRPAPGGWNNLAPPTRWQVYNWEIDNSAIPPTGQPNPAHLHLGDYPPPPSDANRRLLHVGVVSCQALGLTGGKSSGVIFEPDGFAKIFLIAPSEGPPNAEIYGEYTGWSGRGDKQIHVDIQLYE